MDVLPAVVSADLDAAVLDLIGGVVVVLGAAGRIVRLNSAAERFLGCSREAALGKTVAELREPEAAQRAGELLARAISSSCHRARVEFVTETGQRRAMEWSNQSIESAGGRGEFRVLSGTDVTEAERWRCGEAHYRALFEAGGVGKAEGNPVTGRLLRVNEKFCQITGYSAEELLAMTYVDLTHPEDRAANRESFQRFLAENGADYTVEKRYVRKDGRVVWVQVCVSMVRDADLPDRSVVTVQDITLRKEAEEKLRRSEQRFRRVVESNMIAIAFSESRSTRVSDANDAFLKLLGVGRERLGAGLNWDEFTAPEDLAEELRRVERFHAADGTPIAYEKQYVRADGTRVPVLIGGAYLDEGRKEVVAFIVDLSERKRIEAALREQERRTARLLEQVIVAQEEERGRLARGLHDETSQSLTSVLVALRMVEEARTIEEARAHVARARQAVTGTLLDVHRLASGLRPSVLDDLGLEAALDLYAREYERTHGIRVEVGWVLERDGAAEAGKWGSRLAAAVETAIYRIVQEALTNVARHAGARAVRIEMSRSEEQLRVLVRDDGKGFDVAEAMGRVDDAHGLGLRSMQERAALLGGTMAVESAVGRGSVVSVSIPLSELAIGAV